MKTTVLRVNPGRVLGKIKPMHAVNNFPRMGDSFEKEYRDLHLPFARLHDTVFINPHLVDIPAVFPDFDADENLPESYDFAFTDVILSRLHEMGTEPFYRLGVSIENYRAIKPYWIHPPKDFEKWARICEHIVAHYNEGWADGFYFGIRYWEIWNEPENYPDPEENQMWTGTFDEYIRLYEVTANHLKARFPDIRVGGYASCGFYAICEEGTAAHANVSPRKEYFIDCFEKFLSAVTSAEHHAPLDFFSWHSYSDVKKNIAYARYCRAALDRFGLTETESILNEWNPGIRLRGTLQDSANILSNQLALQREALDLLMYYDFRADTDYCGVFDPVHYRTLKAYQSFRIFSELYSLGNEVECLSEGDDGIFAVAASDGTRSALAVTNPEGEAHALTLCGIHGGEGFLLSEESDLDPIPVPADGKIELGAYESVLIRF